MRKNEDRKLAEERFLKDRGRVTNKELAKALGVHPATVARWKKLDEWDLKLVRSIGHDNEKAGSEDVLYAADLRHLAQLNDRIDLYLQKKELLPSEILELAQAKWALMSCMEIIHDQMSYSVRDVLEDDEELD
jgi:DNA-directed RNA polymerase sigma subunit (sigma70/sigma32)